MGDTEDPIGINDKIEILSTDDQRIKAVGELLSSDSSRMILKLLFNDQMTANQIAQKTEISLPLVIYHLKKMQEAGIVKIAQTAKNTKSHDMKYYTVDKFAIVILPSGLTEKAKASKSLFNSFNRIYRFTTIGGAAIAAWFSSQFVQQNQQVIISNERLEQAEIMVGTEEAAQKSLQAPAPPAAETAQYAIQADAIQSGEPLTDIYISIIVTLGVVIIGLIIERILRARRKE
ncbi:MAG: winged helix-turn-helix domain-containing protein [Candidatus Nitrosotenuis sp.]